MLYVFDSKGNFKPVTNCVPQASHWGIYRRARREAPALVEAMRQTISEIVESGRFLDSDRRYPNSSWLGSEVLRTWPQQEEWNRFCGDDLGVSSALFGEIMWVTLCEAAEGWCTTLTSNADPSREERVYWRYAG